jgi:deoxyadenosine/deoxycytidine kinase
MYIAFEGPIGAGKTTLACLLAEELGPNVQIALEGFERNSFLEDFYKDQSRWALPMQLTFLLERRKQLGQINPGVRNVVADHSLLKEKVFAPLVLQGDELALYNRLSEELPTVGGGPDLFVYLDTSTEELLRRIALRGRAYEGEIDRGYLDRLRAAYDVEFAKQRDGRVLRLDTGMIDLNDDAQLKDLWNRILAAALSVAKSAAAVADAAADPV